MNLSQHVLLMLVNGSITLLIKDSSLEKSVCHVQIGHLKIMKSTSITHVFTIWIYNFCTDFSFHIHHHYHHQDETYGKQPAYSIKSDGDIIDARFIFPNKKNSFVHNVTKSIPTV